MRWLQPTRHYAPRWLSIISYPTRARGILVNYDGSDDDHGDQGDDDDDDDDDDDENVVNVTNLRLSIPQGFLSSLWFHVAVGQFPCAWLVGLISFHLFDGHTFSPSVNLANLSS